MNKPQQFIDTHVHIWNFEKAEYEWLQGNTTILNRSYTIDELEKDITTAGVTHGVLVQAANNLPETDYMLEVAAGSSWLKGVVGWLPLQSPALTQRLLQDKYLQNPLFKGVRHLIHDEPDVRWLLQPQVVESLALLAEYNLTYDVVGVLPGHIETALQIAEKIPGLKMVFDHLNQPPIASRLQYGRWGELMKEAAKHNNIYVKISGLGTTAKLGNAWAKDDVLPYVNFVLQHFGVDRCFCGGDWPVSLLAGNYVETINKYINTIQELLPTGEQNLVYYANANRFYNL